MLTLIIGKDSVGKSTYVAQHVKDTYPENTVYVLDHVGDLTDKLSEVGLHITHKKEGAEIVVSDGIKEAVPCKNHYFYISTGEDLDKTLVEKAKNIIIFPMENPQKISELLEIPVDFLKSLKPYEPIRVI